MIDNNKCDSEKTIDEEFHAAETLLSIIQKEYEYEANRKRDLETRTGILLALLGALTGFYVKEVELTFIKTATTSIELTFLIIISIFCVVPIVTMLFAFYRLINVYNTKEYERIGLGGFSEKQAKKSRQVISYKLAISYKAVVETNDKVNTEKANQFQKGIKMIYWSITLMIVSYLLKQFILLFI